MTEVDNQSPRIPTRVSQTLEPVEFTDDAWMRAYQELERKIRETEPFPALVKAMTGYPKGNVRRARVLSNQILVELKLPDAYRSNVYGAAITAHQEHTLLAGEIAKDD